MATLTVQPDEEKRLKGLGFLSNNGTDNFSARVITVNGVVTAEQMDVLQQAAKKYGNGRVGLTTRLTFEVQGIPYENVDAFIAFIGKAGMITGGTGSKIRPIVSCKGTICQYGQIDTFALSKKIHEEFYLKWHGVLLPHKFKIAVGGCPNNCVKPDLNDFAIIGNTSINVDSEECTSCKNCAVVSSCPMGAMTRNEENILQFHPEKCNNCGRCVRKTNDGKRSAICPFDVVHATVCGGYDIRIGGRWGKWGDKGQSLGIVFKTEEEVLKIIEKAVLLYREQGITGERFAQTIHRIGFDAFRAQILSDDVLGRKQAILDAKLHLVGGAKC